MITFALETVAAGRAAGAERLLEAQWREIAHYQDILFDPDWECYQRMEDGGRLKIYTARADGELIGYVAYIVNYAPHYKSSLLAVQDVLYVEPSARGAHIGRDLIAYSESALRELGVQVVYQHQKVRHPALGTVLEGLGYEHVEKTWAKRLDRV
jgi:GNAT superfamily N-acetyltransferase